MRDHTRRTRVGRDVTVSLCVVARNEAAFIGACLESARPIVDEMIVVDTGSSDATVDIARRAGARVFQTSWPGDLGRAHGLPLQHARGDWVLSLDADEVLDPATRDRIATLICANGVDAYRLPVRNYTYYVPAKLRRVQPTDILSRGALAYIPTSVVRLFRRRRHYRFSGQLHQRIGPSILEHGGRIETATVVIHHYGFLRFDRAKTSLYRILARRQAELTPEDARTWIDLGLTFSKPSGRSSALAAYRRARALGCRAEASFLIGRTLLELGRERAAIPVLRDSVRFNANDDAADCDRADAYELLGHAFETLHRHREAEKAYRSALRLRADSPGALNNLAGLLLERGALGSAERLLARLVAVYPGLSTAWATTGALRLVQGDLKAARRACEAALEITPLFPSALVNLALVHERAGRRRRAADARRRASELTWTHSHFPEKVAPASGLRARSKRPSPGGVLSVTSYLHGGSGRVLVDAIAALDDRRHHVVCIDPGDSTGQGLRQELRRLGVDVCTMASAEDVTHAVGHLQPAIVLHHWSGGPPLAGPVRCGSERWIAVGHSPLSMPPGYDHYVVLSDFHHQFQRHLPRGRVSRIPNGVDLRRFPDVARPSRRDDVVTIAMLTRLDPGKFPRQLMAFLPPLEKLGARLVIAGRGARRYELEPEIARRRIPVRFAGPLATALVPAFLAGADIGLHLTEVHEEVCSIAILEMLAAGLPIVGEPKGCLPEMIVSGENGFLADDPNRIAEWLTELIRSRRLRRRFGANSRRRARAYSMDRYRAALRALIDRVCSEPPSMGVGVTAPDPVAVTGSGWRPSLTYLICAPSVQLGDLLGAALQETGLAGIPETYFRPDPRAIPRGSQFAPILATVLESGATPNGVFGAVIVPEHRAALLDAANGGRFIDGRIDPLSRRFRNLHYVWIDGGARGAEQTATAEWKAWLSRTRRPIIRVRAQDVMQHPERAVRTVLRRLGLSPTIARGH